MNLRELRTANIVRNSVWDPKNQLDVDFFSNELAGELGEACNILKKLHREALGLRGSRTTMEQLADELADIGIMLDLLAMRKGFDVLMVIDDMKPIKINSHSIAGIMLFEAIVLPISDGDADEFGEAFGVLKKIATHYGIDLMEAIPKKFNATSHKNNLPIFIGPVTAEGKLHPEVP